MVTTRHPAIGVVLLATLAVPILHAANSAPVLHGDVQLEDLDAAAVPTLPAGWATVPVHFPSGTEPRWATNAGTVHPAGGGTRSSPNLVYFNSYSAADPKSARLYRTTSYSYPVELNFWMYHDTGYLGSNDRVQAQVSTDGGTTWLNVGAAAIRNSGTTGWQQHMIDLSAYSANASVLVGLLGISGFGNDCHLDDIQVETQIPLRLEAVAKNDTNSAGTLVRDLIANSPANGGDPITDVDAGAVEGLAVVAADTANGQWQHNVTGSWQAMPAVSAANVLLLAADTTTRLRFVPNADFTGSATVTVRAWDQTTGTNGGTADLSGAGATGGAAAFSLRSCPASVLVSTPPAFGPAIGELALTAIDEDSAAPAGDALPGIIGAAIIDPDAGAQQGLAVTAAETANGQWQYSLNSGVAWNDLPVGLSEANALLLASAGATLLRFTPAPDYCGSVTLTVRAWEQSNGLASGSLADVHGWDSAVAYSASALPLRIVIRPINDAPVSHAAGGEVMTLPAVASNVREASNPGVLVRDLIASSPANGGNAITDPDSGASEGLAITGGNFAAGGWQYRLADGIWRFFPLIGPAKALLLGADDVTRIRFVPVAGFSGSAALTVHAWDQTGGANGGTTDLSGGGATGGITPYSVATTSVSITVTAADSPLVFESGPLAFPNPSVVGQTVSFAAAASDIDGGSLAYSWDFQDGGTATGPTPKHAFSAAGMYSVRVTVTNENGSTATASIQVAVGAAATVGATDSDGDGYSDQIETTLGSNPDDPTDVPAGMVPITHVATLPVKKLTIKLNEKPTSDSFGLSGALLISEGLTLTGQKLAVNIGGIVKAFALNEKGTTPRGKDSFKLKVKTGKDGTPLQVATFTAVCVKGSFAGALADEGLSLAAEKGAEATVPVTVLFNGVSCQQNVAIRNSGWQWQIGKKK